MLCSLKHATYRLFCRYCIINDSTMQGLAKGHFRVPPNSKGRRGRVHVDYKGVNHVKPNHFYGNFSFNCRGVLCIYKCFLVPLTNQDPLARNLVHHFCIFVQPSFLLSWSIDQPILSWVINWQIKGSKGRMGCMLVWWVKKFPLPTSGLSTPAYSCH